MNVWVIGRGYPTTFNGMRGSFELEQAKLLARNNYKVCYIALTLSFRNRKDSRGIRKFEEEGVSIYTYSHFYFPRKLGVYIEKFEDRCWRMLFNMVEEKNGIPDIIHVHYPSMISSINEIERYRKQGVKLFVTEHWSRILFFDLKGHEQARLNYYASHANCFACVGESLKDAIGKLTNISVPMEIIPNIVAPIFFEVSAKKNDKTFTFVVVGRLVPLKQFDKVIEQFLKDFSGNNDVKLKIIGSGAEQKKLESLAKNNTQISFTGEIELQNVAREIAGADVLVSFSKYETFAVPVIEAWACGKPVIVSDMSGVASCVSEETGIVVSSNSIEQLGTAMKVIYTNRGKYSDEQISSYAKERFSDKAIIQKLNTIYLSY